MIPNTGTQKKITRAIYGALGSVEEGESLQVGEVKPEHLAGIFVKFFGYAAKPIADQLVEKGGKLIIPPDGHYVSGTEGPLKEDKLEQAVELGEKIAGSIIFA